MSTATVAAIAREANKYVAGWLQRQPAVKEESITDWLLDFFDQRSQDIRYYQFNRFEEAKFSGADWDWWFLLNRGCFKIRVQAKKIGKGKDHYHELARSNRAGYQIDTLLNSSALHNFYPIYALYGKTEGVEKCHRAGPPTVLSISSAQDIYTLLFGAARRSVSSGDILARSIPLECLFSCPLANPQYGPRFIFENYFREKPREVRQFGRDNQGDFTSGDASRGYEQSVPGIILTLFETREINSNTEGFLREYQSMFTDSNGVVIVRLDSQ